jgi:hypothetical protein
VYCSQNPVKFTDPLGLRPDYDAGTGHGVGTCDAEKVKSSTGIITIPSVATAVNTVIKIGSAPVVIAVVITNVIVFESPGVPAKWVRDLLGIDKGLFATESEDGDSQEEPASDKTAKSMANQIEKDLGKVARREFHDMKGKGKDRSFRELKQDAKWLYEEAGKTPPDLMR